MKKAKSLYISFGILAIFAIAVGHPILEYARGPGRDRACRNCMGSISCALSMYSMSWNEQLPPTLNALYPDQVSDLDIFRCCHYSGKRGDGEEFGLVYLPGLNVRCLPDTIIMFCKKSHRGEGRNVLSWPCGYPKAYDGWPGIVKEDVFQNELKKMLNTPEYRAQYTEEAIKIMVRYLEKKP